MKFDLRPDTPRSLARCGATVAPGQDAREALNAQRKAMG